jgi:thioredoxin-like negative regulator of GroEL
MDKIATLSGILEQNPTDSFARYALAMAYVSDGRSEDALGEFAVTLQHNPDYVPAYQMSAQTLLKLGRTDEARSRLTEGLVVAERANNSHAASEMQAMLDEITAPASHT